MSDTDSPRSNNSNETAEKRESQKYNIKIDEFCGRYTCSFCGSDISLYRLHQHLKTKMCTLMSSKNPDKEQIINDMDEKLQQKKKEHKDLKKKFAKKTVTISNKYYIEFSEDELDLIPDALKHKIHKL